MQAFAHGRFEPVQVLNQTAGFSTLLAHDRRTGSKVVIKLVRKGRFNSAHSSLAEFYSFYLNVDHSYLCKTIDAGLSSRGYLYSVREFVNEKPAFKHDDLWIRQLIAALCFLHQSNQIHGRIKPSNVFVQPGELLLCDPHPHFVQNSVFLLDLHYCAPEVINGQSATFESDLYSLGAMLYRTYSGKNIFEDFDFSNLKSKYLWATPEPLTNISHVSGDVASIIHSLLNKDPKPRTKAFTDLMSRFPPLIRGANRGSFIGRDTEIERIKDLVHRKPGLKAVMVRGERGSGKTRLVEELRLRNSFLGQTVLIGSCSEKSVAFGPIIEALEPAVKPSSKETPDLGRFAPTLSRYFGTPPSVVDSYPDERRISDFVGLIKCISDQKVTTLIIEDAHQADENTRKVICQVVCRAAELRLTLVITTTSPLGDELFQLMKESLRESFMSADLPPLDDLCSARIAKQFTSTREIAHVVEEACGNPAMIEYVAKGGDPDSLPKAIRDTVDVAISTLTTRCKVLGEVLSVFSAPVSLETVKRMTDFTDDQLAMDLDALRAANLIRWNGRIVLKYTYIRKNICARLSLQKRTTLHRLAFIALREDAAADEMLAYHAMHGCLFSEAIELQRKLAEESVNQGDFARAILFYERNCRAHRRIGKRLDPTDERGRALCYARVGRTQLAKQICERILNALDTNLNTPLRLAIHLQLASPYVGGPPSRQIELYRRAMESLPPDSSDLPRVQAYLAAAYLRNGQVEESDMFLNLAEAALADQRTADYAVIKGTRLLFLLHAGRFSEGVRAGITIKSTNVWVKMSVLTNLALCWEHLGHLNRATAYQKKVQVIAEKSDCLIAQVVSSVNLAAFEFKRGNINDAVHLQSDVWRLIASTQDVTLHGEQAAITLIELARTQTEFGKYRAAVANLRQAKKAITKSTAIERLNFLIAKCELAIRLEHLNTVADLLRSATSVPLSGSGTYAVELLLIQAQYEGDIAVSATLLERALNLTTNLRMLYDRCRVLNELARLALKEQQPTQSHASAGEALQIARRQGYRAIIPRSLLQFALSGTDRERLPGLSEAQRMAREVGMPELVAECSYYIGRTYRTSGQPVSAIQAFTECLNLIAELVSEVPLKLQTNYLKRDWRAAARKELEECKSHVPSYLKKSAFGAAAVEENKLFADLYRLRVSASVANSLNGVFSCLTKTLESAVRHACVVKTKTAQGLDWHAIRVKLTDDLIKRLNTLEDKSNGEHYLSGLNKEQPIETIAWIPFEGGGCTGGIYVESLQGSAFTEHEMEFLILLGDVVSHALVRIQRERPTTTEFASEYCGMVGNSKSFKQVCSQIEVAGANTATVLIEGESGTGKELVAKAIHEMTKDRKGPFVAVDCGAIPEGLFEAELFGAKKGSYTGAVADRSGLFEAANQGTIFLDEISNTSLAAQAKLLRVLQEREVRRLGEAKGRPIDVRLIAATNRSLDRLVQEGKFRQDLLYRLKVLHIQVPPLRNRKEDIRLLATAFLNRLNAVNQTKKHFAPSVLDRLLAHPFHGNVRELQNIVERSFFSTKGATIADIQVEDSTVQHSSAPREAEEWFRDLTEGKKSFWSAIHDRYKKRDISRERIIALVDFALRSTRGSYKDIATAFQMKEKEYRRFMDFLRRNDCLLDFRPYRKTGNMISKEETAG